MLDKTVLAVKADANQGAVAEPRRARDATVNNLGSLHSPAQKDNIVRRITAMEHILFADGGERGRQPKAQLADAGRQHRPKAHEMEQRLPACWLHCQIEPPDCRINVEHIVADDGVVRGAVEDRGLWNN